ncbi:MFS transporter [Actinomadura fulvescens]|uniref:DHA2 family efflux MFS transporter permease subunit n=1 Tax=Actinomadura fulvescens TaxID=46160 RepID=A0ABN3PV62_9ACTN
MSRGKRGVTSPWRALLVLCVANFLILLDTTIVTTAAPEIMRTLDAGIDEMLWVLNAYLLTFASLLIVCGRLGDVAGPRTVFAWGLVIFTVASLLCAVAQTPEQLVAARVGQGLGAAALVPQALVLITVLFPADRRGAAFGVFTATAGIAAVSGPTLGGFLITATGWESIFYLNVPVGLAGLVLAFRFVPDLRPARAHSFDVVGVTLATAGLVGIVYGLVEGQRHDWGPVAGPVTIPRVFAAAVAVLAAFVLWERRQPEPLVPGRLFRDRNFGLATCITLVTSFSLYGLLLVFVIETQTLLGMSPLRSGVAALPLTLSLSAVAPVAGRLADRVGGRYPLAAGLVLYAAGVLGLAFVPTTSSTGTTFILPMLLVGLGMGLTIAPATTEAMRSVEPRLAGAASGVLNTARQLGAALGAAVIGAVLQNRLVEALHREAAERAGRLPPSARASYLSGFDEAAAAGLHLGRGQHGGVGASEDLPPGLAERFAALVREAFGQGFVAATRPTLSVVAVVLVAGAVAAVFVERRPAGPGDRSPARAREDAAQPRRAAN